MPGETLGSHLYYSPEVETALAACNAVHLFIYRDPLDVITSEAFYLAEMNRWHRMHKHFAKCVDDAARLRLAMGGLDDRYPECNARLLPYAGWRTSEHTICIRYEDIAGENQQREIERIATAHAQKRGYARCWMHLDIDMAKKLFFISVTPPCERDDRCVGHGA